MFRNIRMCDAEREFWLRHVTTLDTWRTDFTPQVPLDYTRPKGSKAAVPLIKISAEKNSPNGTYQGMLLINPGMHACHPPTRAVC